MEMSKEEKDAYTWAQIEDELKLAPLLGWLDVTKPSTLNGVASLMGAHKLKAAEVPNARQARTFLPRWRRDWGACGELIVPCGLTIEILDEHALASAWERGLSYRIAEAYENHPDKDSAARAAMVGCAILVLKQKPQ